MQLKTFQLLIIRNVTLLHSSHLTGGAVSLMEDNSEETGAQSSFKAFISYSHADARLVRKLHSQLEAYRLPKGLGEISAQNAFSHGLGKIFRDREYLSVAQDLSSTVKDALGQSEVLLVVCSPNAKGSHWVEREIQYFRGLHPDRPILAALVDGEPVEAFPLALTEDGMEPLAADLRKEGDGWKLGFLKLVAGIVGVPLDALVQRDSQRQTTRVMAVTGVIGFFALCMVAMAFAAIQARNEAQFQQGQAEGLIAYNIGDLRTQLKGVGRLDVMKGVNERTLDYFRAQKDLSGLSSEGLAQRAAVLLAIGEDELKTVGGDEAKALDYFAEAYRTTEAGLVQDQDNSERIFEHAQSAYWLGYHAYDQDDWVLTEKHWSEYRELTAKLYSEDPTNSRWVIEAGSGESNICTLELSREGELTQAKEACTAAVSLAFEAAALEPSNNIHLERIANRHAWLATVHEKEGDFDEEYAVRLEGEKHATQLLARDPRNRDWQDLWLSSQISLAESEFSTGNREQARRRISAALPISQELVRSDPENKIWSSKLEKLEEVGGNYER